MMRWYAPFLTLILALALSPASSRADAPFLRGDADSNGKLELTDPVVVLGNLFLGSPSALECVDAADSDDSGVVDVSDAIYLLEYLFLGGSAPPPPFATCGHDETDDALDCQSHAACAETPIEEVQADVDRDTAPDATDAELRELVAGNTAFALDLYHSIGGEGGNIFYSPYSISLALAMTYAGARENTAAEMASTLHFALADERLHPAFNALELALESRGDGLEGEEGDPFQLNVANSIWGQKGYTFLGGFLDVLARHYGAGMRLLDFIAQPEPSRLTINDWVSDKTQGRIEDLLPQGSISELTRLVLTNAIYFKASWNVPFLPELTQDGDFHRLDGSKVTVPMMSQDGQFGYTRGPSYQAVELPYLGEELSMIVLLPDRGTFGEFESFLDTATLESMLQGLAKQRIDLRMPRFGFEFELPLNQALTNLGMADAFAPGAADFSGMDGTRNLFIHAVLHKAFIAVDEKGTEAAAATAVVVGVTSVPPMVAIDRPFVFLIRDIPTGAILFLGRVVNPAP